MLAARRLASSVRTMRTINTFSPRSSCFQRRVVDYHCVRAANWRSNLPALVFPLSVPFLPFRRRALSAEAVRKLNDMEGGARERKPVRPETYLQAAAGPQRHFGLIKPLVRARSASVRLSSGECRTKAKVGPFGKKMSVFRITLRTAPTQRAPDAWRISALRRNIHSMSFSRLLYHGPRKDMLWTKPSSDC